MSIDTGQTATSTRIDWHARRDELKPDMVFVDHEGDLVKLDRRTPGDGTRWNVLSEYNGSWCDGLSGKSCG